MARSPGEARHHRRALDVEEAAQRERRSRARRARGPSRAGSARSAGTRARARRGRSRARCAGSRAARSPCRARGRTPRAAAPPSPHEQALDHERAADEPVRRADELHHLDLTPSREDRRAGSCSRSAASRRSSRITVAIVKITSITCATWSTRFESCLPSSIVAHARRQRAQARRDARRCPPPSSA